MEDNNIIYSKSKVFALRIIQLSKYLLDKHRGDTIVHILTKQLIRSGTSIGANISESIAAQSTPDFICKLHISLKEGDETKYWLELLHDANYLNDQEFKSIYNDNKQINGILVKILKKKKENLNKQIR